MPALGYGIAYPFKRSIGAPGGGGGLIPPFIGPGDSVKTYLLMATGQVSVSGAAAYGLQLSLEL